jgi:hypothetical protein
MEGMANGAKGWNGKGQVIGERRVYPRRMVADVRRGEPGGSLSFEDVE